MKYIIKTPHPQSRFVLIEAHKEVKEHGPVEFQLPSWRPGRYELGNFAKNLRGLVATTEGGIDLPIHKINKDRWRIDEAPAGKIILQYEYYAAQPDAGACWLDNDFLYLNPVHCILYDPIEATAPYFLHLQIPSDYQIACSLKEVENNVLRAENLDELLDAPFFAAKSLQHRSYSVNDYQFHVWIYGECQPDWTRIISDFEGFTRVQLDMMKSFPVAEYHFLILLLPYRFYHGVEHQASTVLALGPGYQLMSKDLYTDLIGVASHELFHAWNVKTLRPHDFVKYDYTKENYSRLGWVYEGFTTYYGDLFLARSKFFNTQEYFSELNQRIQKHKDNAGRFYSSVAESSFDTWLDGYVSGVPARKTSIYDEGSLIALMLDLYIRRASKGKNSLDDLYVHLFHDFSANENGYRESDILRLAISLSDKGVEEIFNQAIHARKSYESMLQELLPAVGCWLSASPSKKVHEHLYGLRVMVEGGITKVAMVLPGSPAEVAGIAKDDEISACNGWKVEGNLSELCALKDGVAKMTLFSLKKEKQVTLKKSSQTWFDTLQVVKIEDADPFARELFTAWTNLAW